MIIADTDVQVVRRRQAGALASLVLGAVAMGASPIFVRLADVGPYASAFWRTFLALPFLFVWARMERRSARGPSPAIDGPILLAGFLFTGDLFFWHLSILATTVANATFLATTAPICVAIGARFILGERVRAHLLSGLMLCIAGGAALVGQSYGFAPEHLSGDVFGLVTALFFGGYILAVRAGRERRGAGELLFLSTAITAACLFVIAWLLEPRLLPQSAHGLAALVALAVISQVAGQGLVAVALGSLPATFSSLVIFLEAVAAAAFGWMILGERLGALQAVGGVLILSGIWLARPRDAMEMGA